MPHKDIHTKPGSSPEAQLELNGTAMSVQDGGVQGQEPSTLASSKAGCSSVGSKRPRNVEDNNDSEEGGAEKIPKLDTGKLTDEVMGETIEKNDQTSGGEAQQVIEGSTPSQPEQEDVIESDDSNDTDGNEASSSSKEETEDTDGNEASSSSKEETEDTDGNEASSSSKEETEDTASDSASGQLQSEELTDEDMGNAEQKYEPINGRVAQQSEQEDSIESDESDEIDDNEAASSSSKEQSEENGSDSSSGQLQSGEKNHSINGGEPQQKIYKGLAPSQPEQEYEYESEESADTDGNEASSSSSEEQGEDSESDSASDH